MSADKAVLSALPDAWGGPFFWFRNDRGNLELIRLADIGEWVGQASDAIRAHLESVRSR